MPATAQIHRFATPLAVILHLTCTAWAVAADMPFFLDPFDGGPEDKSTTPMNLFLAFTHAEGTLAFLVMLTLSIVALIRLFSVRAAAAFLAAVALGIGSVATTGHATPPLILEVAIVNPTLVWIVASKDGRRASTRPRKPPTTPPASQGIQDAIPEGFTRHDPER